MTEPSPLIRRQAERLLRIYPREWRVRYGDEFSELMTAEIADGNGSWTRTVDVAFSGIMARLAGVGLCGTTVEPSHRPRRCLATFGCVVAVLLTFALSMWSQLIAAQRWVDPATGATRRAIVVMTVAVAISVTAILVAAVPLVWTATAMAVHRPERGLRRSLGLFLSATAVWVAGGVVFRHGWPGAGAPPWAHQSQGLGGAFGFLWASTIAVSAYWVHPSTLLSLPLTQIAWMFVSPLAVTLAATGAARTLRRIDLPARLLRFVSVAGRVAIVGFGLFVVGTLIWLVDGGPGPGRTFQPGTVDLIGLAVISAGLAVADRAVSRTSLPAPSAAP